MFDRGMEMNRLIWILAIASLFVACGAPTDPADPSNVALPNDVAAATASQGTARTFTKQTMNFEEAGQGTLTMRSVGIINFDRLLQSATMSSEGTGTQGEFLAQQTGTMRMVSEGLTVYIKSAYFQQAIPGTKEWVKMDMQAMGEQMGMDLGSLMPANQSDPAAPLDYLEGIEDVEEVGREKIHGADTIHYRGRATFETLKSTLQPEAAATIEQLESLMDIDGFDVEAWLDDENRARRVKYTYDALPMPAMDGTWTFLVEFFDFGVEVDVEIPPAHKVTDMLELMRELEAR